MKHEAKTGLSSSLILNEIYDEIYGICPHVDKNRPLSSVALHEQETFISNSMEYKKLKEFAINKIGKHFKLSYLEYIQMPLATHESMIHIARDLEKKASKLADEIEEEFENN